MMENEKLEFSPPMLTTTQLGDFDHKFTQSTEVNWSILEIPDLNE